MDHLNSAEWINFLDSSLSSLVSSNHFPFMEMKPAIIPEKAGIYLITEYAGTQEIFLYIGRTKNLRRRLYTNHLMGDLANARLKKYLCEDKSLVCFGRKDIAKRYIKENCHVRWIIEDDTRKRGALECYLTGKLFPKYGIAEEH